MTDFEPDFRNDALYSAEESLIRDAGVLPKLSEQLKEQVFAAITRAEIQKARKRGMMKAAMWIALSLLVTVSFQWFVVPHVIAAGSAPAAFQRWEPDLSAVSNPEWKQVESARQFRENRLSLFRQSSGSSD